MKKLIACALMSLVLMQVSAQSTWTGGVSYYHGAMFKYLKSQPWLNYTGLFGVEAKGVKVTRGSQPWEYYHGYPRLKAALTFFDYRDPEYFGHLYTAIVGLNYGIANSEKFRCAPGFGLGYSTRFNSETNRVNKAVSTRISFIAELDFIYQLRLSEKILSELSLSFRHGSNGNIRKPNYGMNFVVAGLSFNFLPESTEYEYIEHPDHEGFRKFSYSLIYSIGWKDPRIQRQSDLYQVQTISAFAAYRFSNVNSFVLGLDGIFDTSQYQEYINQKDENPPFDEQNFDNRQLALTFGNIFHFGRLGIITQGGLFLYRPYKFMKFSYQRYGFQYTLYDRVILHSALKAYFGSADLVEFGIGIKL